jgi:dnd system-associated protein 4
MGDTRIKVAKDKADLVKALRAGEDTTGPFQSYADVLVFAASLGMQRQSRKRITEYSKEIDPIRQDIFSSKGYDQVINLISIADANDPRVVASNQESETERIILFEEYANAGLEMLKNFLSGSSNYHETILLLLSDVRIEVAETENEDFDLTQFL